MKAPKMFLCVISKSFPSKFLAKVSYCFDDEDPNFFLTQRASINALKEGEDQKKKTYTALCALPKTQEIEEVKAKL